MINSPTFLAAILDTIDDHITVIDRDGEIIYVNHSWEMFGEDNACRIHNWDHVNYLTICEESAAMGDTYGKQASAGIRKVIDGKLDSFYFEYPCHSPDEKRWFMMRTIPLQHNKTTYYVISHLTITERVEAEHKLLDLSRIDGLTQLYNRRHFDTFLKAEWQRCKRHQQPLSLAIVDLDYFKRLNDRYGHPAGDDCLKKVAKAISKKIKRPSDLCARYGGEEFAIVLGNTAAASAFTIASGILDAVRDLKIPNIDSSIFPIITASIGLVTTHPYQTKMTIKEMIKQADIQLYHAKGQGRNQIVHLDA